METTINKMIQDISDYIFVADAPCKVDAIFLPGGSFPEAPEYAAELFHQGYARYLIPSGGISIKRDDWPGVGAKSDVYTGEYHSDFEFFMDVLMKNGVSQDAIIGENQSRHTRDNAFLSRKVIDDMKLEIKSAIIVCKAFHARRCLMLYQMAFPHVSFLVCPVHSFNITKDNWFTTEKGIDRVFGELARCGNQFVDDVKTYLAVSK